MTDMIDPQVAFFQSLSKPRDPDAPKVPALKFLEMNVPQQGTVTEVYPTTEKGYGAQPDPVDKNGNPKPLLIVTVKQPNGELGKIYFKGALLFQLRQVMAEQGLSALPIGALVGAAWTSEKPYNGFMAKQFTVQLKVA